ncbi:acetolactate synthase small subunit [Peribacillus frigoritolerans]|uniref:acetolactate synthase small subunit n=1 Tax=Peribacillus frigoritolerans TaxID=450367 RepID=UPI001070E380|nr:acetolactate synthase small subunit [Peribacillus frigoritolerans]TFH63742.1 acetolactate synthase small subunit [Peribacillus frigoritolerans]
MKGILSLTVNNRPGVLNRITNLFTKRNYNIEGMTVGPSEQDGISRMTFVVDVDDETVIEQITKQLNKQIDVLKVYDITNQSIVARELALIKILVTTQTRAEIYSVIEPFRASVIDVSKDSVTVQITGESDKIEAFIELIKPYGIKELARTGTAAIPRGMQIAHAKSVTIV